MLNEVPQRSEWRGIAVRTLIAVFILAAVFLGVSWWLGQRVPNGTNVAGVDIGNLTAEDAEAALESRLDPLLDEQVTIEVDGEQLQLTPREAGFGIDVDRTVSGLTGVSMNPVDMWRHVSGDGGDPDLVVTSDRAAAEAAVAEHAADFEVEPRDAEVGIERGEFVVEDARVGRTLDVRQSAERLLQGWPERTSIEGVSREVEPSLSQATVDAFVEDNQVVLSAPVRLEVDAAGGDTVFTDLQPSQIARLVSIETDGDEPVLRVDQDELLETAGRALVDATRPPRDATVRLGDNGRPEIVGARGGRELDEASMLEAFTAAIREPEGERRAVGELDIIAPEFGDEDAEALGVDEVVSEFSSTMPDSDPNEPRTANIIRGAESVNGTLVLPGESFSLFDSIEPITAENGYQDAGVIQEGRLVAGIGGGLSQLSTVTLNTAWFAGVDLVEFTPHAYYISRYPEGREATIFGNQLDNIWRNDTDYGILVQTMVDGDQLTMRFWSTEEFEVESETGGRYNITQPESRTDDSAECLPQSPMQGFTVDVTRVVRRGSEVVKDEVYTTTYQPSDSVSCTG